MSQKDANKVVTVVAYLCQGDKAKEISYTDTKIIGNGSFGVVYQARLCDTDEIVAIKKVLQDRRFKNRELQIMRQLDHPNVVQLKYFFHLVGDRKDEVFLNLVLEFVPETVYRVARRYVRQKETIPILFVKLYMYQLFRSLAYIHHKGICHRDIKPQNLLLNPTTGVLKLCDFGSAKVLIRGEPNVSYICSRYYRAPELIFGAVDYTCQIDVWSSGCVLAELLLGQPIFPGESGVDQLVEIIKVLGTPTRDQIHEMNPDYKEFKFPQIKSHPWSKVFRSRVPQEAIQLVSQLLDYTPSKRLEPLDACLHIFFDDLRSGDFRLSNDRPLPPLFNLTPYELTMRENMSKFLPPGSNTTNPPIQTSENATSQLNSQPPSQMNTITDPNDDTVGDLDPKVSNRESNKSACETNTRCGTIPPSTSSAALAMSSNCDANLVNTSNNNSTSAIVMGDNSSEAPPKNVCDDVPIGDKEPDSKQFHETAST